MVEDDTADGEESEPHSGVYARCQNCGRYLDAARRVEEHFCSADCASRFRTCVTCGRHFRDDAGYRREYCSRECAVTYVAAPGDDRRAGHRVAAPPA